jgi:hypothetical protein
VRWSYLLWDLALASLMLFAYRIVRTLREAFILFTRSCPSPWPSESFVCCETLLFMLLLFFLGPWLYGDSFLSGRFHLCFHSFYLASGLLGASFLPKCSCLCYRNIYLAPNLLEVSFLLKHFCLRFCDFNLAPSILGASFLLEHFCIHFHDFD